MSPQGASLLAARELSASARSVILAEFLKMIYSLGPLERSQVLAMSLRSTALINSSSSQTLLPESHRQLTADGPSSRSSSVSSSCLLLREQVEADPGSHAITTRSDRFWSSPLDLAGQGCPSLLRYPGSPEVRVRKSEPAHSFRIRVTGPDWNPCGRTSEAAPDATFRPIRWPLCDLESTLAVPRGNSASDSARRCNRPRT